MVRPKYADAVRKNRKLEEYVRRQDENNNKK